MAVVIKLTYGDALYRIRPSPADEIPEVERAIAELLQSNRLPNAPTRYTLHSGDSLSQGAVIGHLALPEGQCVLLPETWCATLQTARMRATGTQLPTVRVLIKVDTGEEQTQAERNVCFEHTEASAPTEHVGHIPNGSDLSVLHVDQNTAYAEIATTTTSTSTTTEELLETGTVAGLQHTDPSAPIEEGAFLSGEHDLPNLLANQAISLDDELAFALWQAELADPSHDSVDHPSNGERQNENARRVPEETRARVEQERRRHEEERRHREDARRRHHEEIHARRHREAHVAAVQAANSLAAVRHERAAAWAMQRAHVNGQSRGGFEGSVGSGWEQAGVAGGVGGAWASQGANNVSNNLGDNFRTISGLVHTGPFGLYGERVRVVRSTITGPIRLVNSSVIFESCVVTGRVELENSLLAMPQGVLTGTVFHDARSRFQCTGIHTGHVALV